MDRSCRFAPHFGTLVALFCATVSMRASAQTDITFSSEPLLGEASRGTGWSEVRIHLENKGKTPIRGRAKVHADEYLFSASAPSDTYTDVTIPEGRTTEVKLPIFVDLGTSELKSSFEIEGKEPLATSFPFVTGVSPTILDLHQPSRLLALRGWPLLVPVSYPSTADLAIAGARHDVASGDPLLPFFPASYGSTTLVLVPSDIFVRLEERPRRALLAWTLAGGTLAFAVSRNEDLRHPAVIELLGGEARETDPSPSLKLLPVLPHPSSVPSLPTHRMGFLGDDGSPFQFLRTDGVRNVQRPVRELGSGVHGYVGGRIVDTASGPIAPYGLGEVRMMPADPGVLPYSDDVWIQSRLIEAVTAAWSHRVPHVTRLGAPSAVDLPKVRKVLDPNQSFQLPLGLASILLLVFAVFAGPVLFSRALKEKRPFAPLKWVPLASGITFLLVVFIGLASKGFRGRVRRLVIVEAQAGFSQGAAKRLRGFFFGGANDFRVHGEDEWSVARVFAQSRENSGSLVVHRDGLELTNLAVDPWKTTVVLDEGIEDLGGTVSFTKVGGLYEAHNTLPYALERVLMSMPGDSNVRYFAKIESGGTAKWSDGTFVGTTSPGPSGTRDFYPSSLFPSDTQAADLWSAVVSTMDRVDWFPTNVPTLLGELARPKKKDRDEGLRVEIEKTAVRFVGTVLP